MIKFDFSGKTGVTESVWLQGIAAVLVFIGNKTGYSDISLHSVLISQFALSALGALLRWLDKKHQVYIKERLADKQYTIDKLHKQANEERIFNRA